MAILNWRLGSSSYGNRYGSSTTGSSAASNYLSALGKDRSSSRDRSGYGSGYGSDYGKSGYGSGSDYGHSRWKVGSSYSGAPYTSKHSSDTSRPAISALATKYGDLKSARSQDSPTTSYSSSKPPAAASSTATSPRIRDSTTSSFTSRPRDSGTSSYRTTNDASTSKTSGYTSPRVTSNDYSSTRTNDSSQRTRSDAIRTRTSELPTLSSVRESKYVSKPYTSKYSNSGYTSDTKSGYGSDYSKSGYGSGYGSGSESYKRYSWNRSNSFIKEPETPPTPTSYRPYSRQNSLIGNDTTSTSTWKSRLSNSSTPTQVSTPSRPTTLSTGSQSKQENDAQKVQRPSAFQTAIGKLSQESKENASREDKKSDLLSPNAVKVLPTIGLGDVKLKNKAPADYSSATETSDDEANEKQKVGTNKTPAKTLDKKPEQKPETVKPKSPVAEPVRVTRPMTYLCAAPSLPTRREHSPSKGLTAPPAFKKSTKYVTNLHEIATSTSPSSSKWLKAVESQERSPSPRSDKESNTTNAAGNKSTSKISSLPPKSPLLDRKKNANNSHSEITVSQQTTNDVGSKEYRKSVLNMNIEPEAQAAVRRQQEEKREELLRLKKYKTEETNALKEPAINARMKSKEELSRSKEDSEEDESEDEEKEDKRQSGPLEKPSSRSKVVERKHSKGKGDLLRKSGSFRKQREKQSSQSSKVSSSTSSDSETDSKSSRTRTSSFSTRVRKRGSRDDMLAKTASREKLMEGRKTRNNSESVTKVNSKGSVSVSKSRNSSRNSLHGKSNNSSRNSLLGDKKLSLGPDIDIGEKKSSESTVQSSPKPGSKERMVNGIQSTHKPTHPNFRKGSVSSSSESESESESSEDSSESAGEEGCFFSISKSKSMKKSRSSANKLAASKSNNFVIDIAERTSPDGKESLSRNQSGRNLKNEQNGINEVETTFNLVIPYNTTNDYDLSNKSANAELVISDLPDISPTSSKSNFGSSSKKSPYVDNNTDCDVSEMPDYDATDALSKSNSKHNVDQNGYEEFEWPTGSPKIARKKLTVQDIEQNDEDTTLADFTEGFSDFQWPDGSPKVSRKNNYIRTQWDTDTETEATQNEWSDDASPISRMPQLEEETEDDVAFEWPSSPEISRKNRFNSAYGEQYAGEFEWPSSPELPTMKDPQFTTNTTDIDNLLNENTVHDTFIEMEKHLGFSSQTEEEKVEDKDEKEGDKEKEEQEQCNKVEEKVQKGRKSSFRDRAKKNLSLFIDKLPNIDDIIGTVLKPLTSKEEAVEEGLQEIHASDVKVHDAQARRAEIDENIEEIDASAVIIRRKEKREALKAEIIKAVKEGLDDTTLQVYRDGDYGTYLDLESSLAEQADDIDGLTDSKKNAIILRTQLSVRVHAIIEKLQISEGRELRRALFSLKQIFQDDKDLVHAFVQNDGLKCLVKVGSSADHNYQTYILRALGQVMLYVDGMTGISTSPETLQWLYSLVGSRFRLVVKTALKLLLVFVEYSERNALRLIKAIKVVDRGRGDTPWAIIMRLLEGKDCPDTELQIYAMTLVNKTLNGLPDQDSYYDQTDYLEEQDIETLIQKFIHNPNSDLDLLQQLTIYEAVLAYEDGDDICRTRTIDPTIRQDLRYSAKDRDDSSRRKSKRHFVTPDDSEKQNLDDGLTSSDDENRDHVTVINIKGGMSNEDMGAIKHADAGVTPALRRRRERAERQKTFLNDQEMLSESRRESQSPDGGVEDENRKNSEISWLLELMHANKDGEVKDIATRIASLMDKENVENNKRLPIELTADSSVKDILGKLSRGASLTAAEHEKLTRIGDVSGRIQKAKGDLLKAQSKGEIRPQRIPEPPKKSENDLHWENLVDQLNRPLELCDLDFTDLTEEDDKDLYSITHGGVPPPPPPPPPPMGPGIPPPPPMENGYHKGIEKNGNNEAPPGCIPPPPPIAGMNGVAYPKSKKTIKLFWKEVRSDLIQRSNTIWDTVHPVNIDTQKLEHLFESRAKDLNTKNKQDQKGIKEVIVLDSKRSNVINIGMTKLPPPRTIKTAILKMDSSIINREGIEKLLLTMLPTAEEKKMIQEAALSNPELPLGSAEQFLMMLASISELPARLQLWLFKLDFEVMEKEVAEPLMDLKQGLGDLQKNTTFGIILSILLSVGNFLNGSESRGFQIDYLSKVPEVKDTVHKHSLLHHLCHMVIEKYPETSDLYSELGTITRASKVDFDDLQNTIEKMQTDCKASWDHLKAIAKHDGPTQMKLKMSEFLADAAERIIVLGIIYRRVFHRFQRFLMWLGMPPNLVLESKPQAICSIVSEFALEYRTCRERVLQQIQKKATHRERNKTRGKMITEERIRPGTTSRTKSNIKSDRMEKFKSRPKTKEEEADNDLRQLLNYSDVSDTDTIRGKNTWRRTREGKTRSRGDEAMEMLLLSAEGVDDALLDSLVKTATQSSSTRSNPRERKRSRHADRKSCARRSRSRRSVTEISKTLTP